MQNRIKNGFKITILDKLKLCSPANLSCISNRFLCKIQRNRISILNLENLSVAQQKKPKKRLSFSLLQYLLLRFQCLRITFKVKFLQILLIPNTLQKKVFLHTITHKFLTPSTQLITKLPIKHQDLIT